MVIKNTKSYLINGQSIKLLKYITIRNVLTGADMEIFIKGNMNRYGQENVTMEIFEISDEAKIQCGQENITEYMYEMVGVPVPRE